MFKERLIILVLVLTVFITSAVIFLPVKNKNKLEEKVFWINKTHTSKKFDWIFVGDSRIYRGISPAAINEIIPDISILNFGYSSGSIGPYMLNESEKKLDMQSPNKTVIIGVTPYSLTPKAALNEDYMQEKNRKREEIIDARYFGKIKQVFAPTSIYDLFSEMINKIKPEKKSNEVIYYQEYKENGWVASWKSIDDPEDALGSYKIAFNDNKVSDTILTGFIAYVKKWVSEGITVYGFRPPTTKKMVQIEDSLSGYRESFIRTAFEKAGGFWILVENGKYRSYDGSHLRKDAAIQLSKDIAIFIQQHKHKGN